MSRDFSDDPFLNLLGGIIKRAVLDARRGDAEALFWLRETLPEWRRFFAKVGQMTPSIEE